MKRDWILGIAGAVMLSAAGYGQQAAHGHETLPEFRVPLHTASDEANGLQYGLWAAGSDYKASFGAGFTFVPYLGREVAENRVFAWRTVSVKRGEQELLARVDRQGHDENEFRYVYAHDATDEVYDVRPNGVEQSFRFAQRPAGQGDLVVTGAITTNLVLPSFGAAHRAFELVEADGTPRIRYGAATVIDANGATLPITTALDADGRVELRVPSTWVDAARFPIVIDPIVSTKTLQSVIGKDLGPGPSELARDDSHNLLLLVWTRFASASDSDVYGQVYTDGFGKLNATVFTDVTNAWSTTHPACAYVSTNSQWVIALERQFAAETQIRLHGQSVGNTTTLTGVKFVTAPGNTNFMHPDVGGVIGGRTGAEAMIVATQTDSPNVTHGEIYSIMFDPKANTATSPARVSVLADAKLRRSRPAINQDGGGVNDGWFVCFQEFNQNIPNDDMDLAGFRFDGTGKRASGNSYVGFLGGQRDLHSFRPVVAGYDGRYGIGYVSAERAHVANPLTADRGDIMRFEVIEWPVDRSFASRLGHAGRHQRSSVQWIVEDVAFDDRLDTFWGMVWRNTSTGELSFSRHGYDGIELDKHILVTGVGNSGSSGAVCFDNDSREFYIHYARSASVGGGHAWLGTTFQYGPLGSFATSGTSCGGRMRGVGVPMHGSDNFEIQLSLSDKNTFAVLYLAGAAHPGLPLDGIGMTGCLWQIDLGSMLFALPMATNDAGFASFALPLPGTTKFTGTLRAQWLHGKASANAIGIASTERLEFTIKR